LIFVGAALAATSLAAAVLATRPRTAVGKRLARLTPRTPMPRLARSMLVTPGLAQSGVGWTDDELVRAKVVVALLGAVLASAIGIFAPIGPLVVVAAGYVGFILPTVHVDRAAAGRRSDAAHALVTLVEWAEALVSSGRPAEPAFVAIAANSTGAGLIDGALAAAARSYALGAPLFPALGHEAAAAGLPALAAIASDLERSRDLGRGALVVLRDHRDRLRASERAASLDAAGRIEGRLMLVLVLCYLPALMLLVVIPLFLGLLDGLFV
jgi:Flp pilus assembly protein TadB